MGVEAGGELEVIVARSAGTCFGVEAAINIAEEIRKPILGPLVHNPKIVGDLASQGIPILERYADLDQVDDLEEVVITAHGYPKQLKVALRERGITFHDATCPVLLKWVYRKIRNFEADGYHVILIGNPDHAEIIASRSYGEDISVVYDEAAVEGLPDGLEKTVAICQTTITKEKFDRLVGCIRRVKYPGLRAVDTRCKPVKNQQEAVEMLAQWVDAMIIVGGYNSSNTTNLARIAKNHLPQRTYHIDADALVQAEWLVGVRHLGIGAGTSTPKEQIAAVQSRIAELYPGTVAFRVGDGPQGAGQ
ncbi:4-hydroxy-3-methylbut-2-enyl diphosphate reductase [Candidatus Poribacteria bacterium]|jgi:4-hydroxy-3-methylbut-2-en-1-yl diphosphate reductase|nr:4-hydroxy-3-methylbut-2-enyl diphosphate reductase [Candidatus Poribacteria bacterium]MBT5709460.1 4-hydroxy-3-methylbut-2-enyl diphosphate reductase [Candidatus Poribacteria bacterium]MBT7806317.1 4-hydroxy-3-methylbut-2-enyl diphosphate reductase [Candidatus Poribacteria bacterium]